MKSNSKSNDSGFTLLETVIAIGVLAVLLTGFMVVFAPAAEGIRKSINVQQADRLASTVEQEFVTLRNKDFKTGFSKAFDWIKLSDNASSALLVYQYRGKAGSAMRSDGTPEPQADIKGKMTGKDYIVVPMMRRVSDTSLLKEDLSAVEGAVYLVKCTQLVFKGGALQLGDSGQIKDPKGGAAAADADEYPEAVIAFSAGFFIMPARTYDYFTKGAFTSKFPKLSNPVFTRNLAVRR
jgi:prepilin-type N-terminal cleavage/methylation domain-containing protein